MKKAHFRPNVPGELRAIEQRGTLDILKVLHRYADTGEGIVRSFKVEFGGLSRLRVANHRVLFEETADATTVHCIRARENAYQ